MEPDVVVEAPREAPFVHHILDGNLAVVPLGRTGLTYQLVPWRHHALVATAYRQLPSFVDVLNTGLLGFGGELGWRVYSGSRGATGFFVGLSAVAAYHANGGGAGEWFTTVGGAADAGIAFVVGRSYHIVVGGGVQLAHASNDNDGLVGIAKLLAGTGIFPRLTIALGHSLGGAR